MRNHKIHIKPYWYKNSRLSRPKTASKITIQPRPKCGHVEGTGSCNGESCIQTANVRQRADNGQIKEQNRLLPLQSLRLYKCRYCERVYTKEFNKNNHEMYHCKTCQYCKKTLARRMYKTRHEFLCKMKNDRNAKHVKKAKKIRQLLAKHDVPLENDKVPTEYKNMDRHVRRVNKKKMKKQSTKHEIKLDNDKTSNKNGTDVLNRANYIKKKKKKKRSVKHDSIHDIQGQLQKEHEKIHVHSEELENLMCRFCFKQFPKSQKRNHEMICKQLFKRYCRFCQKIFTSLRRLQKHERLCSRCKACEHDFSTEIGLRRHERKHCKTCQYCKKKLDSPKCKKKHELICEMKIKNSEHAKHVKKKEKRKMEQQSKKHITYIRVDNSKPRQNLIPVHVANEKRKIEKQSKKQGTYICVDNSKPRQNLICVTNEKKRKIEKQSTKRKTNIRVDDSEPRQNLVRVTNEKKRNVEKQSTKHKTYIRVDDSEPGQNLTRVTNEKKRNVEKQSKKHRTYIRVDDSEPGQNLICVADEKERKTEKQPRNHRTYINVDNSEQRINPKHVTKEQEKHLMNNEIKLDNSESVELYKCCYCAMVFPQEYDKKLHEFGHLGRTCKRCKTIFEDKVSRKQHQKMWEDENRCCNCTEEFIPGQSRKEHDETHLQLSQAVFDYKNCNEIFIV